ncbi:MAG: hypothetical protein IKT52_07900 [Oscillospiraceae bacterium]|nr:hypothetical protein [Oscillospiraceae bacterium]
MTETAQCVVCGSQSTKTANFETDRVFYECPVCGRFDLGTEAIVKPMDYNKLAPYLLYNRYDKQLGIEYRYHTTLDKDTCDLYRQQFDAGSNTHGRPVHMNTDMVDAWYPKSFAEKIDKLLLYLGAKSKHIGEAITLSFEELVSATFTDRYEYDSWSNRTARKEESCKKGSAYILHYLEECKYIKCSAGANREKHVVIQITPAGYSRIDSLQKYTVNSRNVLVAMKFGDDTRDLREAIRKGITDAGYIAIFIDEVQHNEFITPELLKHIRDSKFVVVDLTHQNNGAYFEEGYAMGLGKPVIQLCQKDTRLHFDIAQKNTIMWATEADIPERLTNRIMATIE